MQKLFDINEDSHSIRCIEYTEGNPREVSRWVICTHGFGGNKENHSVKKLAERITTKYKGYGVMCFDWPCHGKDARSKLELSECQEYLDIVNRYMKEERGAGVLYNYSVSMGAYMTLLYLHEKGDPYEKIALRSPAIQLYKVMTASFTEDEKEMLGKKGRVRTGFERKITIPREFLDDVKEKDITRYEYFDDADRIIMFHGTKDKMVPLQDSVDFSENNVIELYQVENADHPFTNPDCMDYAIQMIVKFFAP